MRKYTIPGNKKSGFYAHVVDNKIVIISFGNENITGMLHVVLNKLYKHKVIEKIENNKVELFIDNLYTLGTENRFNKLIYNKGTDELDVFSNEILSYNDLPLKIRKIVDNFHKKHFKELFVNSALLPNDIKKVSNYY